MSDKIFGILEKETFFGFLGLQIVGPAQIERAELFVVFHSAISRESFLSEAATRRHILVASPKLENS